MSLIQCSFTLNKDWPLHRYMIDTDDYRIQLVANLSKAWELAKEANNAAQVRQKIAYDKDAEAPKFQVGEKIWIHQFVQVHVRSSNFPSEDHMSLQR